MAVLFAVALLPVAGCPGWAPKAVAATALPGSKPGSGTNASFTALLNRLGISKGPVDTKKNVAEYRLKNGLSVLLAERRGAPVVTVMMLYRVGSRNEAVGYTGATHFLEHLMFKGSAKFDPKLGKSIDDVLKPIGGLNNATTWFDRTSYFEVVPAEQLELALSFEADRMRHLLLREADRISEMTVVRNELERSENDPDSVLSTQLFATAYREHPYHHPTIGWRSDVEGVPMQRLRQFYEDFYWPNNATLLIIGDIERTNALTLVAKHFGRIPSSPKPIPKVYTAEPPQQGERRFVVQRGDDVPRVSIAYHAPKAADKDTYALAVLQSILGDSSRQSTRLYKGLVDKGLASYADCYSYELRDPSLFTLSATVTPGTKPEALEQNILEELEKLKSEPVTPAELSRAKISIVKRLKLATVDPLRLASQIGEGIASVDWKWWSGYESGIEGVTADDIMKVAQKYFTRNNRTVGVYLPRENPAASNLIGPAPGLSCSGYRDVPGFAQVAGTTTRAKGIVSLRGDAEVSSGALFDETVKRRISQRSAELATSIALPGTRRMSFASRVRRKVLGNGLALLAMQIAGSGTVSVAGKVQAGQYFATADKSLVPEIVADMLTRGSEKYSKEALSEELENMGSSLDFEADNFWIEFNADMVTDDLGRFLPLLSDVLQKPRFLSEELEKSKKILDSEIKQEMVDTSAVARNALDHVLYRPGSVYYQKGFAEKLAELSTIDAANLKDFHARQFNPANTVVSVVGDIEPEKAFSLIEEHLAKWPAGKRSEVKVEDIAAPIASKRIAIPVVDKENVDINIGHPVAVNLKSPDFFAALIANAALGHSTFSTRLAPVREKHGLTYGISSAFQGTAYGGAPWIIDCSVNPGNIEKALKIIREIVANYAKTGITEKELNTEAKHLAGEFVVHLRTPTRISQQLCRYEMLKLGPGFIDKFGDRLKQVTRSQANQAIRKYFDLDRSITTMAGTFKK